MSPIAIRPSQLSIKRKFEVDDGYGSTYSPPPIKKIFIDRNPSPSLRQTPSPMMCPSPDSCASYDGRVTPKHFISKLITSNSGLSNSMASSPATEASSDDAVEMDYTPTSQGESRQDSKSGKSSESESSLDSSQVFKEPDSSKIRSVEKERLAETTAAKGDNKVEESQLPRLETDENMVSTTSSL